ncbi:MAG TPA: hypothetical protein VLS45_08070 [Methylomicrobium sp.]|nr:hypothetical protein [Methylomicrobium sp.]
MTHWYLTLPSNSSMNYYKENTAARYTTKLPDNVELNGEWEVALAEITYPNKMTHTINGKECSMCIYTKGDSFTTLHLPKDKYDDPAAFMKDFIEMKQNYFQIKYDEKTNEIEMNCNRPYVSFIFSDTLARMLGFDRKTFSLGNVYHGKLFAGTDPSTMFVYCDLIEHVTVGDTRAPLLRTFGMEKSANEVVHRSFTNLVYVPVQKKQFDTIEVNINTDTGEPMPFASGKSVALLHFRRSSNPYFLLKR